MHGFRAHPSGTMTKRLRGFPEQSFKRGQFSTPGIRAGGTSYFLRMHGQSNSEGINLVTDLPSNLRRRFKNTYVWDNPNETLNGGRWARLKAGVNNQRQGRLQYYGAEIGIADLFERNNPNDRLYISKYAVGGTTVFNTASPNNWNIAVTNGLLDKAIDRYDVPSQAAIPGHYQDLGLIWMQGETDATNSTWAAAFLTNTSDTLAKFRTGNANVTMPIYVCQLNHGAITDANGATVRINQSKKTSQLNDVATYPHNIFFKTDNYAPHVGDEIHFDQEPFGVDLYNTLFDVPIASGLHASVQKVIDIATEKGYTLPGNAAIQAWNTFMLAREADGSLDIIDALWIIAWNNASLGSFSNLNHISPGAHELTIAGTTTYGTGGRKGNGTDGYMNTNFIPATHGINYVLDSASRFLWIKTAHSTNAFLDGCVTLNLNTFRASSSTGQRINQTGNLDTTLNLAGVGYTAGDRIDSTNQKFFKSATKSTRTGTSTGLTTVSQFILRSSTNFGDTEIALYGIASSLSDTQHNNINTDFQTFLTAIGS